MKEFGSDFHLITEYQSNQAHLTDVFRDAAFSADGRQCIVVLVRQNGWRRLWMPEYFCYEVIETINKQTGIEIVLYPDYPFADDKTIFKNLPYKDGDVLLRINYFGMRGQRSEANIPVPVIEDHTHDLLGNWALYSDADWCIASLRKTLPLPEGGMVWSPKGHELPIGIRPSDENEKIAAIRWEGMEMKAQYLKGEDVSKDDFRKRYTETEEWFDSAEPTLIDERSNEYVHRFDVNAWQSAKRRNWQLLCSMLTDKVETLLPEDASCTLFSLVVLAESRKQRDILRYRLIEHAVYPAILWLVPDNASEEVKDFSRRMLSIHCDGRYTEDDILQLADVLNHVIGK
jgi:hypothetical protein